MRTLTPRWLPLLAGLTLWDLVLWLFRRASEDPGQGMMHLVVAVALLLWWHPRSRATPFNAPILTAATVALAWCGIAALTVDYPLVRSLATAIALGFSLLAGLPRASRFLPAILGLSLLLPFSEETTSYLIGYPARVIAGRLAAALLSASGFAVEIQGALLEVNGTPLFADAPCAGLHMGWTGLAIALLLCLYRETSAKRTLLVGASTIILILAGNALRMAALAQLEHLRLSSLPTFTHNAVGTASFLLLLPALIALTRPTPPSTSTPMRQCRIGRPHLVVALFAVSAPLLPLQPDYFRDHPTPVLQPEWPTEWQGKSLQPASLTELDTRFSDQFPGALARFHADQYRILYRYLEEPSRQLHAGAVCYQAHGYRLQPEPAWKDAKGSLWSTYIVDKKGVRLLVREQIRSLSTGRTWPDVSAWYWGVSMGKDPGPWLAATIAKPIPE